MSKISRQIPWPGRPPVENFSNYNSNEVRYVMELDLPLSDLEKACAIAKKHGKEEEFRSKTEDYRGDYTRENLCAVLDDICVEKEYRGKETPKSVDQVVADESVGTIVKPNVSYAKVALKTTKSLISKSCWYYPLVGALPGAAQEWVGKKLGDNPVSYSKANMAVETIVTPFAAAYLAYSFADNPVTAAILVGVVAGVFSPLLNYGARRDIMKYDKPLGSFLLCAPLYLTAAVIVAPFAALYYGYKGLEMVKDVVKDTWQSALKEEQQKALPLPKKKKRKRKKARIEEVKTPEDLAELEHQVAEEIGELVQEMRKTRKRK